MGKESSKGKAGDYSNLIRLELIFQVCVPTIAYFGQLGKSCIIVVEFVFVLFLMILSKTTSRKMASLLFICKTYDIIFKMYILTIDSYI